MLGAVRYDLHTGRQKLESTAPVSSAKTVLQLTETLFKALPATQDELKDRFRFIERQERFDVLGIESIRINTVEAIPQADVLESLRLFAKEVMPAFAESKHHVAGGSR